MAEAQEAERTEPATPKRREDARKKGDVAQSREVGSVLVLGAALLAGGSYLGVQLVDAVAAQARAGWSAAARPPASLADFHSALLVHGGSVGAALLPVLALLAAVGLLGPLLQTGPLFSPEALQPKPERLDPIKGFKRLFNADRVADLAKSLFKVAVVGGVAWVVLGGAVGDLLALSGVGLGESLAVTGDLARRLAVGVLAALAVMALADVAWVRFRFEQRLRMSRREVRDELKQREGSPQVRSRQRALQLEVTRSRMIAAVADADVVITNPTHYAVALRYERARMGAPRLLAKGRAHVAHRIRAAAEQHGVPIVEDAPLARALHRAGKVGREIPAGLFEAVAEVLAYVYRLDPSRARRWGSAS